MGEAKVPDKKSDWKAIDIFLFSNGQKSSPPRKYHLVTDQLDWWKATLCFLAKSQYGSLHNMVDLYTIEGQKVETPMQLSHNTAYVAVAPPDLFINGSYEKYLIKATRSWEKGQIRRSSNAAGVIQDEVQIGNDKSNSDNRVFEPARLTRDGSVTLKTIVASIGNNQASVIVKPDSTSVKNINNIINPVKQSDEILKPPIVKNLGTVKRNSLPSPPRSRKPSLKRKDNSVKINMEATKDRSSLESNNNKIASKSKIYKPLHKTREFLAETVLTKVEEVLNEVKSSESLKLVNMTDSMSKTSDVDKVVEDNETAMTTNYYMNTYSEKPSIAVNPDINLSDNVNRQGGAHELFDESHHFVGNGCDNLKEMDESKMAMNLIAKGINVNPLLMEHGLTSTKVTKPEKDVDLINKEGTVNLKLNIEIWNYTNEANNTTNGIPTVVSEKDSVIILKPEKRSQFNVEEKALEHNKTIANEIIDEGNHKLLIVKCVCLNQDRENAKIPVKIGNSNLLVYLPILNLNESCKRCDCKEKKETKSPSHNSNMEYPVKKTNSSLSLYKGRAERIFSHSDSHQITSKNNSTEMKLETNTIHDRNEITTIKRKSVAIKENQEMYQLLNPTKLVSETVKEDRKVLVHPLEPEKSECVVMKKESTGILHKSASKFTQTEWCDVLMEVKLQNYGHYSFHLPPLEMLKHYKL